MDAIQIRDLELWAHVGVLEQERRDGQWFRLDIRFHLHVSATPVADHLSTRLQHSLTIETLQGLPREICGHYVALLSVLSGEPVPALY